ncbi:UNVERIFIED_CONTAM: hypothetical protein GTU68_032527 [Idotea baltica]|nr:hypothetical protein [Idotea baltica]
MSQTDALLPGATVGVIGGGQLGRYFVLAARRLGYVTWVLDPDANAPAMQLCEHPLVGAYDDNDALLKLAEACDAVTIEFENVPAASLELIASSTRIAPPVNAVTIAQDRHAEKTHARELGLETVPYAVITASNDIDAALVSVRLPAIMKTTRLGYDGKGQQTCHSKEDVVAAFDTLGGVTCVLEQRIKLKAEVSVVMARGTDGESVCFPVAQNVHTDGILDTSVVPAISDKALCDAAQALAVKFADGLEYVGVLAIEFFVNEQDQLLFNEMAPRPHNSGHYTLDATVTCQFEQQLRALCAQPLGSVQLLSPVCMLNVLGDSWPAEGEPNWPSVMQQKNAHLHLYGKSAARPGRKMGHINCLAEDTEKAMSVAEKLRSSLQP